MTGGKCPLSGILQVPHNAQPYLPSQSQIAELSSWMHAVSWRNGYQADLSDLEAGIAGVARREQQV